MARINRVQKAAQPHTCERGCTIAKGDPYTWAKPGFRGRKRLRCAQHPFRESDLATGLNAEPLAAREEFEDTVNGLEEGDYEGLREAVETFQSALDDYVAAREEGLDAWENGNSMLEDLRDQAQQARDDFEPDVEEFDEEEPDRDDFEGDGEDPDDDGSDEYEQEVIEWEGRKSDHWETAVNDALDAASGLDL